MSDTRHDPQLLKGVLPLLVLALVESGGQTYGYRLVTRLHDLGLTQVQTGSVYPVLTRLENDHLLDSRLEPSPSGPARKHYRITAAGKAELQAAATRWQDLTGVVGRALELPKDTP